MYVGTDVDFGPAERDTLRRDEEADRAAERENCPGGGQCRCVQVVPCRPKRR